MQNNLCPASKIAHMDLLGQGREKEGKMDGLQERTESLHKADYNLAVTAQGSHAVSKGLDRGIMQKLAFMKHLLTLSEAAQHRSYLAHSSIISSARLRFRVASLPHIFSARASRP